MNGLVQLNLKFCPSCRQMTNFLKDHIAHQDHRRCGNCFTNFSDTDYQALPDQPMRRVSDAVTSKNR